MISSNSEDLKHVASLDKCWVKSSAKWRKDTAKVVNSVLKISKSTRWWSRASKTCKTRIESSTCLTLTRSSMTTSLIASAVSEKSIPSCRRAKHDFSSQWTSSSNTNSSRLINSSSNSQGISIQQQHQGIHSSKREEGTSHNPNSNAPRWHLILANVPISSLISKVANSKINFSPITKINHKNVKTWVNFNNLPPLVNFHKAKWVVSSHKDQRRFQ